MARFLRGMAAAALLALSTGLAVAADRTIIILDASGSMWADIGGKPKLEIARQALHTVLDTLPADREIGFMAYGHREKGSCQDIELIVPPAAGTASAITSAADQLKFLGKTPLTAAVKQAAEALKYTEDKATVVLITDGLETCGGDPCALGTELKQAGVDFTAHVVGFGLTAEEGRKVACLAENTGGKYIQAKDAEGLKSALTVTVAAAPAPAPEPQPTPVPEPSKFNFAPSAVMAEGGDPQGDGMAWEIYKANADGSRGDSVETQYGNYQGNLEPGSYVVVARMGEAKSEQPVTIEAGQVAKPLFTLNAGTLVLHPRPSEGGDIADSARFDIDYPGGSTTTYGDTKIVVPAGAEKVKAQIGSGTIEETIQLDAGKTVEKDMIVGVGHVVINAYYSEGGDKSDNGGLFFQIQKAKKKIDGTREDVENSYGPDSKFDLPAGDYVVQARADLAQAEQPFSVKVGEATEVKVNLNAGVLAISAPGAYSLEIVSPKKDIEGKRKSFGTNYGDSWQQTAPTGDYVVIRRQSGEDEGKEVTATVKAGERTEITVE